jgi:hypothetical protein
LTGLNFQEGRADRLVRPCRQVSWGLKDATSNMKLLYASDDSGKSWSQIAAPGPLQWPQLFSCASGDLRLLIICSLHTHPKSSLAAFGWVNTSLQEQTVSCCFGLHTMMLPTAQYERPHRPSALKGSTTVSCSHVVWLKVTVPFLF